MSDKKQTPSQTVGPFFAYGITPEQYRYDHAGVADNVLHRNAPAGEQRIRICGRVLDGAGHAVNDALIELRQDATPEGFGRMGTGTEPDNSFVFDTVKPRANGQSAPHIDVTVLMRGLLSHVFTRIYFSDEEAANSNDPVLLQVPEDRRQTLVAARTEAGGQVVYEFDIRMQGEQETVFFDA